MISTRCRPEARIFSRYSRWVGDAAIFWADVVPTTHHIQPPYIMAYDLDVPRSFASRSRWLARAAEGGWLGLFYHDAEHAFGRLANDGKRYCFEPLSA